jgi:GH25 family lysozyme M1 (1,4-beta-N-acetylmuramidase)
MVRTLREGDHGPEVTKVQRDLNARAKPRHYPPVSADGRLGPRSMWAYEDLGWALGLMPETLREGITPGARAILADPAQRSQAKLDRARERAARMATRTIAFDGTPVFWGLAKPLLRARRRGWSGTLNSADRRKGVAERYGKSSQARLRWCFERKRDTGSCPCSSCNPANLPGQSSHELCSDAAGFPGPVGRALHWWELGLDCSASDQLVALLRDLGYKARKPYSSPSEAHHVNFSRDPGPVMDTVHPVEDVVPDILVPGPFEEGELMPVELEEAIDVAAGDEVLEPLDDEPSPQAPAVLDGTVTQPAVQGVDVSALNGSVDWAAVGRAGYRFAFVRATTGTSVSATDGAFGPARLEAVREAGLVAGCYHVGAAGGGDALAEARHAVETIRQAGGLAPGDLPLALDLEQTSAAAGATFAWTAAFCREVERLTGAGCILFTRSRFWRARVGDPARPPDHAGVLWIADHAVPTPSVPRAWGDRGWCFWQYTESGLCPGIGGRVDLNHWYGSPAAFNALLLR